MEYVRIGNCDVSRIVCGTNPILGRSDLSKARMEHYRSHFTDKNVVDLICKCAEYGINTIETSVSDRMFGISDCVERRIGAKMRMITSTRIDCSSDVKSHTLKCRMGIDRKSEAILVHDQQASQKPRNGEIPGLNRLLDMIHEAGIVAGISCHDARVVEFCEKHHPSIDVYLFPLNKNNHIYRGHCNSDSVEDRIDLINGIDKTFIIMKTLGAGRIPPDEALPFVLENIKDGDILTIGFGDPLEEEEAMEVYDDFCRGKSTR
ncbi:MAG: hypothetical protein HON70_42355 [Lentisphaerae bacterium]|nr:hypothetical protein [Lentisphaerota bacterium]